MLHQELLLGTGVVIGLPAIITSVAVVSHHLLVHHHLVFDQLGVGKAAGQDLLSTTAEASVGVAT